MYFYGLFRCSCQLLNINVILLTYHDLVLAALAAATNIVEGDLTAHRASVRGQLEVTPSTSFGLAVTMQT